MKPDQTSDAAAANQVTPGRYRHYKGKEYTVIGACRHSETMEELVVYRQEYGDGGLWVRPKAMFLETVTVDGKEKPRFELLPTSDEAAGENVANIFDDLPGRVPKELVEILVTAGATRIERIVSFGQASAADFWYDQPHAEWVMVLKGAARLQFQDRMVDMKVGDFINIPAFQKHRVDWTTPDEPTLWLAVHYRENG